MNVYCVLLETTAFTFSTVTPPPLRKALAAAIVVPPSSKPSLQATERFGDNLPVQRQWPQNYGVEMVEQL